MKRAPQFPLRVLYDGSCSVCNKEMEHYRKKDRDGRLAFIDITAPEFAPERSGFSLKALMHEMHAIDDRGTVFRGVEAFWAIWQAFPASRPLGALGRIIQLPVVNALARLAYLAFAALRPYLPKTGKECVGGTCSVGRR